MLLAAGVGALVGGASARASAACSRSSRCPLIVGGIGVWPARRAAAERGPGVHGSDRVVDAAERREREFAAGGLIAPASACFCSPGRA